MKLGPCIDTSWFTADIVDIGGAVGTWNANAGTFTVQLEDGVACGGAGADFQSSILSLIINGSGTVSVSIAGTGSEEQADQSLATATLDGVLKAKYEGPGGGIISCSGNPLVFVQNDSPFAACACSLLVLDYTVGSPVQSIGNWTCTFTVTVS